MRLDDLINKKLKDKKISYLESLEIKLKKELETPKPPKFTALEWAIMEGGGSLESPVKK